MADLISQIKGLDNVTYDLQDKVSTFGGTNFLLGTQGPKTVTLTNATTDYYIGYFTESDYGKSITNGNTTDYFYTSFDWETTSETGVAWIQIEGNIVTNILRYEGSGTSKDRINLADGSGHYMAIFKLSSTQANKTTQRMRIRIAGSNTAHTAGSTFTLSNFMFSSGNKPTDWSPAPEDLATYSNETIEFFQ